MTQHRVQDTVCPCKKKKSNNTHKHVHICVCPYVRSAGSKRKWQQPNSVHISEHPKYVLIFNASWSCRLRLHIYSNSIPVWFECIDPAFTGFTSCLVFSRTTSKEMLTDCFVFYIFISSHPPFSPFFFHFSTHQMQTRGHQLSWSL